jgi:hypothetical protein
VLFVSAAISAQQLVVLDVMMWLAMVLAGDCFYPASL